MTPSPGISHEAHGRRGASLSEAADSDTLCAPAIVTKRVKEQARKLSLQKKPGRKLAKQLQKELGASGLITYEFVGRKGRGTVLVTVLDLAAGDVLARVFFADPLFNEPWENLVSMISHAAGGAHCDI